jgi:hypothetical protein
VMPPTTLPSWTAAGGSAGAAEGPGSGPAEPLAAGAAEAEAAAAAIRAEHGTQGAGGGWLPASGAADGASAVLATSGAGTALDAAPGGFSG